MKRLIRWLRRGPLPKRNKIQHFRHPHLQPLEERLLMDITGIVVGRTLSAYSVADVQNDQLTIDYTVYNQEAEEVSGVLLTTTLEPGVTFASASQLPDRNGQELAWSLGALEPFERVSVQLTVSLDSVTPLQLDGGAQALATLNARRVSDDTPVAALSAAAIPAEVLASTPDANTTDPFVQEKAAELDYDPQRIFDYLNDEVGYESYVGSLRGARGTLWSAAGNSLDEASLGVALFRGSGMPARYAHGTLSDPLTQQLILSMFPESFQAVGYIPVGSEVADPANDPQLLAETRDHYWLQFDSGAGFVDADTSGLPGGGIGAAFTAAVDTFTEVADSLRHKVDVKLDRETYTQAAAALGVSDGLSRTKVLEQTFNSVDLVGRPLTIGHFVDESSAGSPVFTSRTIKYSPYLTLGDEAFAPSQAHVFAGTDYQEVLTNLPLGNSLLTGLFLTLTVSDPGRPARPYERALVDRIGFAIRQGGAGSVTVDPNGPPAITNLDAYTIGIESGAGNPGVSAVAKQQLQEDVLAVAALPDTGPYEPSVSGLLRSTAQGLTRMFGAIFHRVSNEQTERLSHSLFVKAYHDSPRVTIVSLRSVVDPATSMSKLTYSIDLRKNDIRALAHPGQSVAAPPIFNLDRGLFEGAIEANLFTLTTPPQTPPPRGVSTLAVFTAAEAQGVGLVLLTADQASRLDGLSISAEAKARITAALNQDKFVIVPVQMVLVGSAPAIAWLEVDNTTGETISVTEDGGHQALVEYNTVLFTSVELLTGTAASEAKGAIAGFAIGGILSVIYELCLLTRGNQPLCQLMLETIKSGGVEFADATENAFSTLQGGGDLDPFSLSKILMLPGFKDGFKAALEATTRAVTGIDPPVSPVLLNPDPPMHEPENVAESDVLVSATATAGAVTAMISAPAVNIAGLIAASWTSATTNSFRVSTLDVATATVTDATGNAVGSGAVFFAGPTLQVAADGTLTYTVNGTGRLSAYAHATSGLGVAADWENYTASLSGNMTLRLTTDALRLNGVALPAGNYVISTTSAMLGGSGPSTSPEFLGSLTLQVTGSAVGVEPGNGTATVDGTAVPTTAGLTFTGYDGMVALTAGTDTDAISLNGAAAAVLTVSASPAATTTDQNTPASFQVNVNTSFADTYTLTAEAPPGWLVAVDPTGQVTVTPAPGLQGGTFPVRIVARSTADPDLVAQTAVMVNVSPTTPGLSLDVTLDPLFTVPTAGGAQSPTAFRAEMHNTGPAADTYNLTFSNLPAGFDVLNSGMSATVPAGETGLLGLYLQPNGGMLPPPGTQVSFTVTATSATNPAITDTKTVTFSMPDVHGVTFTATPAAVGTTPGAPVPITLTLTAVGNVAETIALSSNLSAGLTVTGLPASVTLQPGQSVDVPLTPTPDAATPLNSTLAATFTAKFNPLGDVYDQTVTVLVRVVVPGADVIADASINASQLGNAALSNRLNDLATALTNLAQNPADELFKSQTLAALDALILLVAAEQYLGSVVPALTADRAQLAAATTPAEIGDALNALATDITTLNNLLSDVIAHRFDLFLDRHTAVAQPNVATFYNVGLQNLGAETTTYDLSVAISGIVGGNISAAINPRFVTLAPGETRFGGANGVVLRLTEIAGSLFPTGFTVTAVARGFPAIVQRITGSLTVRQELVHVASVTTDPPFTNPGGLVNVAAVVLNAVNTPQPVLVSFTAKDPLGATVFTSNPVSVTLGVQTSLTSVNLGPLDTTGFATGGYTIDVTVTDLAGMPLTGGMGSGHLLVGTPVTGSVSVNPTVTASGTSIVTHTLTINTQATFPSPLTLVGQAATDHPAATAALLGNLAYVTTSRSVQIVDIADPANPVVVNTFADDLLTPEAFNFGRIVGGMLIVGGNVRLNATDLDLLIYDLADPVNPVLVSNTSIAYPFAHALFAQGNTIYLPLSSITFSNLNGGILSQNGDVVAVDITNPAAPQIADVLFNTQGVPLGSNHNVDAVVGVTPQLVYAATTTSTGGGTSAGMGRVLVINIADPANLAVANTLDIPQTVHAVGIGIHGNRALVVGTTGGWNNPTNASNYGYSGNIVLSVLDITDPTNPIVMSSLVTANKPGVGPDYSRIDVLDLGNGLFAVGDTTLGGQGVIQLVDITDPDNLLVGSVVAPAVVTGLEVSADHLYAASSAGLTVYEIGILTGLPVTASVRVPKGTGVSGAFTLTNTFSEPPSEIIIGAQFDTLVWNRSFGLGTSGATFTWQARVDGLNPYSPRQVTLGTTLDFISQGTPGSVELAPTTVAAERVITLTPLAQSVAPAGEVEFMVNLTNPISAPRTFTLSVLGVPATWVSLPASVVLPALGTLSVPLRLTPDTFALAADYAFTVTANVSSSTFGTAEGTLTVAGQAPQPDAEAHGVVAQLTPAQATAGQGTAASYVVRVTNTGSVTDTFDLSIAGLPPGLAATFAQNTIEVPPGIGNFRDVTVVLVPSLGTAPADYPFTVTAASSTVAGVMGDAISTLTVVAQGVDVVMNPPSGLPGTVFQMTVTNTGSVADVFNLSLAGPAALVASLSVAQVSLAAGDSQVVTVTTTAIDFAYPGNLELTGIARSLANTAVADAATVNLVIQDTEGLEASYDPAVRVLPLPGSTSFVLLIENTGNGEDAYEVSIIGTTGPVTASLNGIDGEDTQMIPLVRLPGLHTGAILLDAELAAVGTGTITVRVRSLNDDTLSVTALATVSSSPLDFGDAPDSYHTTFDSDGARHEPIGPTLGFERDDEFDANAPLDGTGDDVTNTGSADDEDGVSAIGTSFTLTAGTRGRADFSIANSDGNARLYFWIDFNGDGDFNDSQEQIADGNDPFDQLGNLVLLRIDFEVPNFGFSGQTFARARISTQAGLGFDGLASDGEVEDYALQILPAQTGPANVLLTLADSPDPVTAGGNITYTITVNNQGPGTATSLSLTDAIPANTTFVSFTAPFGWTTQQMPAVGGTGNVVATSPSLANGETDTLTLVVRVNPGVAVGAVVSNTATVTASNDPDTSNNVDTESTNVVTADFGDAPDTYRTTLTAGPNGGARHLAIGPLLGASRDLEPDARTPLNGTGDDASNTGSPNDEDGVLLSNSFRLIAGAMGSARVTISGGEVIARLYGFVDFNSDGDFEDAGEQIADGTGAFAGLTPGTRVFNFNVPDTGFRGDTFARFRVATQAGLSFDGLANDGEVEDYALQIGDLEDCDLVVTTTMDVVSAGDGMNSLREAIICANETPGPDTILVPAGVYTLTRGGADDIALLGDLDITDDLTIIGVGAATTIIQAGTIPGRMGNGIDRVFDIIASAANVTLSDLTIRNGLALGDGGGVRNDSDRLMLANLVVSDNVADDPDGNPSAGGDGGGIANTGTVVLNNTSISIVRNFAERDGGGIANNSGVVRMDAVNPLAVNLTIDNNESDNNGGGIFQNNSSFTVFGTIALRNNDSALDGGGAGGINSSTLDLRDVNNAGVISNNRAASFGGGVFNGTGGIARLEGFSIRDNHADGNGGGLGQFNLAQFTVIGGDISNNTVDGDGGGIANGGPVERANGSTFVVNNVLVQDNDAAGFGGGIAFHGEDATFTFTGIIRANTAQGVGAGVFFEGDRSTFNLTGVVVENDSEGDGGGIYLESGSLSQFTVTNSSITENNADGFGGGIFSSLASSSQLIVTGSTLDGNIAGPGQEGGGLWNSTSTVIVTNSTFSGNRAGEEGGGIYQGVGGGGGSITLLNVTVTLNVAPEGGGLYNDATGNVRLTNSLVADNRVLVGVPEMESLGPGSDLDGSFISGGHNLIGNGDGGTGFTDGVNGDQVGSTASLIDARLGPLDDNGGPTQTHALLMDSPAIDEADTNEAPATDQRGIARPQGPAPDIGAFESEAFTAPSLTINDVSVAEFSANAIFAVILSAPTSVAVTVAFATADGTAGSADYQSTGGTLTFAPLQTLQLVTVPITNDTLDEDNEFFVVNLSDATNATLADDQGVGTIFDDDPAPGLSIDDQTVIEGDTGAVNAVFNVTLSAPAGRQITVVFSTFNGSAFSGSDYSATSGTLTFAPSEVSQAVTVQVLGDAIDEFDETFFVNLANPVNATLSDPTGLGTILDNEAPTVSIDDRALTEGDTGTVDAVFTVSLSAPSDRTVTVAFSTADGFADATDYQPTMGTLTFAPLETSRTITVRVVGDFEFESTENFFVNLSTAMQATIADGEGVGTIFDNDTPPRMTIDDQIVTEGDSGTVDVVFTVALSRPIPMTVSVVFQTQDNTAFSTLDYQPTSGTLTFAPNETRGSFTVRVIGDTLEESDETFFVQLSNAVNADITDGHGLGTILDDDVPDFVPIFVTGADAGGGPHVKVFDASTSQLLFGFMAYNPLFGGGVRVAVGDVNGDGFDDVITGAGPGGGPHVRVFDGRTGAQLPGLIGSFMAYNPLFGGGVYVASADVNGDGAAEVITGADAGGGPHVRVFDGRTGAQLAGRIGSFFAYKAEFNAGVRVAAGDVNGDGFAEVITGMGPGYGDDSERTGFKLLAQPEVRVFSGTGAVMIRSFLPFEPGYRGGVHLSVGHFDDNAKVEIIVGKANGDARTDAVFDAIHVNPFRRSEVSVFQDVGPGPLNRLKNFVAYPHFPGSVRVAAVDRVFRDFPDFDPSDDYLGPALLTAPGRGGGPHVKLLADDLSLLDELFAYDVNFAGGVFVAGSVGPDRP